MKYETDQNHEFMIKLDEKRENHIFAVKQRRRISGRNETETEVDDYRG